VDESWNRHPACKPVYYNKTTYGSTLDSLNTLESYKKDWFTISDKNNAIDSPWPAPFSLSKADVYAYNKIYIKASAEKIFNFLTKAYMWPSWYPNSGRIIDLDHPKQALVLKDKQSFSWVTFGSRQKSQVTLFKKNKALGWTAESPGVSAYHRWFFIEKNGGTEVITEELDYGLLLDIGFANVLAKGLHASHQLWLEKLKKICENEN
jgi:hypothetical protein